MVKLGFIGFGEAAFNIASGLRGEGLDGIMAYDKHWKDSPAAELIGKRAAEAQVELVPSQQALIERSEMVVSAVSADMALSLARASQPFLKADQVYVDINATSPMTKEEIDRIISPVALVRRLCGHGAGPDLPAQGAGRGFGHGRQGASATP